MIKTDIEAIVNKFKSKSNSDDRYTSFDYCYNYFRITNNLTQDIEKSCLVLGFYLASWGMFRGSSFLLKKSVKHFEPTIRFISTLDKSVWKIDVDNYDVNNIQIIIKIYQKIKKQLILNGNRDLTLITKILLGVFGFIPAIDRLSAQTYTTDFVTGQKTIINYPKAKIIDMYGFTSGQ